MSHDKMLSAQVGRIGFWSGMILVGLGILYIVLVGIMILTGSGFPPTEPFQTMVNLLIIITAVMMVFFWTIVNYSAPANTRLFSQASLAFIVIFAALTSINRYVALTVVKQSLASGAMNGLEWFMPYQWPSVMLAIEYLAWGFFFGLACLCLAPVFRAGRLGSSIFWILLATGILSIIATFGQLTGLSGQNFDPFTMMGVIAWGPGLTVAVLLISLRFRHVKLYN